MDNDTENSAAAAAIDLMVLASPDADWCARIEAAVAQNAGSLSSQRLDDVSRIDHFLELPARLWLVDETWAVPVLARRSIVEAARLRAPEFIVRFANLNSANVAALIQAGVRGCLPSEAGADETLLAIRAVLGGELWLSRKLFAEVLAQLHEQAPDEAGSVDQHRLTGRQRQIAACVAQGMSNKQIGRELGISPTTVKTHLHNIFERVGVGGRTLLALRAVDGDAR